MVKVYITSVVKNIKQYKLLPNIIKEINKFKHPQVRVEKASSYLLLKRVLDIHKIKKIKIKLNKFGKPMLENQTIHFNLSHSGGYVVCAVSDSPIGVDIEQTNPNIKSISSRFLTKKELETYISSSDRKLTQIWALKESLVKLTGEGLTRNLNNISLATHTINNKRVYTKIKILHLYKNINFAIASLKPLPKLIPLKRIVI